VGLRDSAEQVQQIIKLAPRKLDPDDVFGSCNVSTDIKSIFAPSVRFQKPLYL